jgi:hypothetical protein
VLSTGRRFIPVIFRITGGSNLDIRAARCSEWARFKHGGSMGKLARDDANQGPEEVHGVQKLRIAYLRTYSISK